MKVVGLIGGIASGKSRAADALVRLGAIWIDADKVGHLAFDEAEVQEALRDRFGPSVFTPDGRIDRKTLSKLVFAPLPPSADPASRKDYDENRAWLERLLHPRIAALVGERLREAEQQGYPAAVLDAPLLLEAGWDRACDEIWFIDAPEEVRLARAQERGWTESEFRAREATQWPLDLKRARSNRVMANSGSPARLDEQLAAGWKALQGG